MKSACDVEWLAVDHGAPRQVGQVWTTVRTVTGQASDGSRGLGYAVDPVEARYVRVHVTRLGRPAPDEAAGGSHRLQLAELEVYAP